MRKIIQNSETELAPEKASWLNLRTIAQVEVTSEDWRYPIESAFDERDERGWRAAERGKQTITLFFDEPQRIRRIWLRFIELEAERTQQFTLHIGTLVPATPDEQCPYPSHRHALLDSLTDPRVGAQWRTATPSRT